MVDFMTGFNGSVLTDVLAVVGFLAVGLLIVAVIVSEKGNK